MNYQDTSSLTGTDARSDTDAIPGGSQAPAIGNTITGAGTVSGATGADVVGSAPGNVIAIQGAGGLDSSDAGGAMQVSGRYGVLNMEADGSYRYTRNGDTPDGVRDVFTYTLADAANARDSATLTIDIGREPTKVQENAQQVVPGPDGVVTLPAGVTLADIHVVGRNLVIDMPDGSQMVIVDGAVFVPQLVLGGVEVPSTNLAALLIDAEPQPAAGNPQSSGGNFGLPPGPLDPGVPLGDLVPPVEADYTPPEFEDVGQFIDDEPEIFVQPDGQPASIAAVDQVDERGLPSPRLNGANEPAGSGEIADGNGTNNSDGRETTTGVILIDANDTPATVTITVNGITTVISGTVPQVIQGQYGTLTITSVSETQIGYTYTLGDNTTGDNTHDDFLVTLTDSDGDQASATLRIDIIDDVPTARPDTDSIAAGQFGPATGNVITDAAAGDAGDSDTNAADTVGADNATLTSVSSVNVPANSDNTFSAGVLQVNGQYGVLTIAANGDYSYTRNPNTPGGVTDTFNYTITDGDGDTSSTTLTISIGDLPITIGQNPIARTDDDAVPGAGGNPGGPGDDVDAQNLSGTLSGSGGDGTLTFDLLTTGAPSGFTYVDGPNGSILVQQVQNGSTVTVLTITVVASTGAYTVTQNAPILHPTLNGLDGDNTENNVAFTINYTVTDLDNDTVNGTLQIDVDDDTPTVTTVALTGLVDEDGVIENAAAGTQQGDGIAGGTGDVPGENTVVTGSVATLFSAGADGPLTYGLTGSVAALTAQGLTSGGTALSYSISGNTLTGTAGAGGYTVFTLTVNPDGSYNFTLIDQLDHPQGNAENDLTIQLGSLIQATDRDGDTVVAGANGLVITVDDDTPTASTGLIGGTVDEDGVIENAAAGTQTGDGIAGGVGDVAGENTVVTGNVAALFNSGADEPLTYSLVNAASLTALGLTSGGTPLVYTISGNTLTATAGAGGYTVFTFTLNPDGSYNFTLVDQLDHAQGNNENDLTIQLGSVIQAMDRDGDTVVANTGENQGLVITVDDDTPTTSAGLVGGTVDEDGVIENAAPGAQQGDGIAGGVGDVAGENTVVTGSVAALFNSGADEPLTYSLVNAASLNALGLTSGGTPLSYTISGSTLIATAGAGGYTVFTFTLNPDGSYNFTLVDQLDHASGDNENDLSIQLGSVIQATDRDGDSVIASVVQGQGLVITVDDDTPTASTANLTGVVDEDGVIENAAVGTQQGDGIAGGPDDVAGENTVASGSVATLFNSGADEPLSYSLTGSVAGLTAQGLTSGGTALTYNLSGNTVTATAGAGGYTVFTFTLNPDGSYTFTLVDQLDHPTLNNQEGDNTENDLAINLSSLIQATDRDGDTVPAGANGLIITVDDDTPTTNLQTRLTGVVDEDGLGNTTPRIGDVEGANLTATGNVTTLFNSGADEPLRYSIDTDTSGLPQNLTSNGVAIIYGVSGNALTGYADVDGNGIVGPGDTPVFTLSIDATTGAYSFTLIDQLDHPSLDGQPGDDTENPVDQDISIDFSSVIRATDADGDSIDAAAGGLVITIDDDMPDEFGAECPGGSIVNAVGSTFNGSLLLPPVGADAPGTVSFVVENGDPVLDAEGEQMSSGGDLLYYFVEGNVLFARTTDVNGDDIFSITLNPNGTFTYNQTGEISSTTTLSITNLSSVGGGNVAIKAIDVPDSPFDLILSTQAVNSVNTNNTEIGVNTGQSFEAGEILRIDLVQDSFVTGSGGSAVLNYGEYYTANAFRQDVSGLAGPQRADFIVRAIVAVEGGSGAADGDGTFYGDSNDTVVPVTQLNIYTAAPGIGGTLIDPSDYIDYGIIVTAAPGGGWLIQNLPNDFDYEITSATSFNAVQIEAVAGTDTFKLGFIDITTTVETSVDFNVPIALTDADGDSVYCDIEIDLGPPTSTPNVTILVDEAALNSVASDPNTVGSDPASTAETQGGDLGAVVSGTGPFTFALVGSGASPYGTLSLDSEGVYTFTLTDRVDGSTANNGRNLVDGVVVYTYQVTDGNGDVTEGTITVNVLDDTPTARPDTDTVTEDGAAATGNVITDNDPGDLLDGDTNAADTKGADNATVTFVDGTNTGIGTANPDADGETIQGQYGTLTINSAGAYTYTLYTVGQNATAHAAVQALGVGETLTENFNYTLTDGDGDQSSSTLIITINGVNDLPTGAAGLATVSEEGLPNGITDSNPVPQDNSNFATDLDGDLNFVDVDGDTLTYTISGAPAGTFADANSNPVTWGAIVNTPATSTLTGTSSAGTVITIVLDRATGEYDVTLVRGMDHGNDANTETEFNIVVPVSVSDGTGSVATSITIDVEDDKPTATLSGQTPPVLFVSDADLATDDSENFSVFFTLNTGGDGAPAGSDGTTYSLSVNPGPTGLFDTATKLPVTLVKITDPMSPIFGSVVGVIQTSPGVFVAVFTVSVNVDTGVVTLNQIRAVYHSTSDAAPTGDSDVNETLSNDLIQLTARVEDADGDFATQTIGIGNRITFGDDFPVTDIAAVDNNNLFTLTQDSGTLGANSSVDTENFITNGIFSQVSQDFGNDGEGSGDSEVTDWDLSLLVAAGTASGLTSGGVAIRMYIDANGDIIGSTATLGNPITAANTIFTISVDEGVVTTTQLQQIDHTNIDPTPTGTPYSDHQIALPDGLVRLTAEQTITDGDLDTDSDDAFIDLGGNIRFADDGPSAVADVDNIAAGFFGVASGNVLTGTEVNPAIEDANNQDGSADTVGADSPIRVSGVSFTLNDNNPATNSATTPVDAGSFATINGQYGVLTIWANGDYSYDRNEGSAGGSPDIFTYTIVDRDGDTSTATLTINIGVNPPVTSNVTATVDDDGLGGANADGSNDIDANTYPTPDDLAGALSSEASFTGSLQTATTGGDGDVDFRLVEPADGMTIGQETVNFTLTENLGIQTLTATIATSPAGRTGTLFTVTLNRESGEYTVTLADNVLHPDIAANDENGVVVSAAISYIANDAGGDSNTSTLNVLFNDDVPTAVNDSGAGFSQLTENQSFTVDALANDRFGADGVNINSATSVTIVGQPTHGTVSYSTTTHLFTYTPTNSDVGATSDSFTYKIIDADGDESTATVNVTLLGDSTPQVVNVVAAVDDDGLVLPTPDAIANGEPGDIDANTVTNPDDLNGAGSSEASFGGQLTVNFGGDTGTVDFSNLNNTTGEVGTETVRYTWVGTKLTATVDVGEARAGLVLFEVTLSPSGAYTVTLVNNILHASGGNNENSAPVVDLNYRAVETGGFDATTTGQLSITFNDDIPDVSATLTGTQLRIDETDGVAAAGGELDAAVGTNLGTVTLTIAQLVNVTALFGADGALPGPANGFSYALALSGVGVDSGFDYSSTNASILLYDAGTVGTTQTIEGRVGGVGGPVAFSIQVNTVTGSVTLTQFLAVEHTDTGSKDEVSVAGIAAGALTLNISATDADGDTDTTPVDIGSIVRFEDDGPRVTVAENINILNSGLVMHTGDFAFDIGADGPNPSFDDIRSVTPTFNINGTNVTPTLQSSSETETTATYVYTFSYAVGNGAPPANNTLTLTFNKADDTYTVDLANPIQPFVTINSTSQATVFNGYDTGVTDPLATTNSQPDVVNVQLRVDDPNVVGNQALWVRLTGLDGNPGTTSGNTELTAGEYITGGQSWVSASNTANGVAGDIVNSNQVLNLELFTSNQVGDPDNLATASASAIYFKLDNIGAQEDFIVNLKLWADDGDGVIEANEVTTRAVYVGNEDFYIDPPGGGNTPGPGQYSGVSLDNNDGLVIIESNDYNFGSETYRIIGAQIATTDQGLTGDAIALNGFINAASPGLGTADISDDENDLGFKIQDIGFVSTVTTAQPATFTFAVTVGDADGDTVSQTLVATVNSSPNSETPATITAAASSQSMEPMFVKTASNDNSTMLASDTQQQLEQRSYFNGNAALYGAIAGAGLLSSSAMATGTQFSMVSGDSGFTDSFATMRTVNLQGFEYEGLSGSFLQQGVSAPSPIASADFGGSFDQPQVAQLTSGGSVFGSPGVEMATVLPTGVEAAAYQAPAFGGFAGGDVNLGGLEAMIASAALNGNGANQAGALSQVLADALAGGAGVDIDGLLANLPGGGAGGGVADMLASQGMAAVPAWDMGAFGGFSSSHQAFTMEALVLHQDAVVQQA